MIILLGFFFIFLIFHIENMDHTFFDQGSYFAKVEQLKKLKQKQEEDKLAARLHSFR